LIVWKWGGQRKSISQKRVPIREENEGPARPRRERKRKEEGKKGQSKYERYKKQEGGRGGKVEITGQIKQGSYERVLKKERVKPIA